MAKILQIRRGSSVQHDKFTGMNGEITFDTDAKTIRVHDGQTVGGFALARKDEITGSGTGGGTEPAPEFDINSVPSEFWVSLFEQYEQKIEPFDIRSVSEDFWISLFQEYETVTPEFNINSVPASFWQSLFEQYQTKAAFNSADSRLLPVKTQAGVSYVFSEIEKCFYCEAILVCKTSEAGYNAGDEVRAWGIGSRGRPEPNIVQETQGISLMLLLGQEPFWVSNKTNGQTANITNENWQLLFRVYY